jgi:hypothetical protein
MKTRGIENQIAGKRAASVKTYVRPIVSKHEAASLLVGSGCGCGYYISSTGNGAGCGVREKPAPDCYYY